MKVEVATRSSPPVRPPCATVYSCLGSTGCLISPSTGTSTSIPSPHSASKDSLCRRTAIYSHSSYANTQTVSKTEKAASFTRANREHATGWSHPSGYIRGTFPSQEVREPPWFKSLKSSQAEAFLRDSDIVVEARLHFFSKHSYNFNQDGNHDLSGIFRKLAVSTGLLGTNIHEIEAS